MLRWQWQFLLLLPHVRFLNVFGLSNQQTFPVPLAMLQADHPESEGESFAYAYPLSLM